MGRYRKLPDIKSAKRALRGHGERAAINTPIQVRGQYLYLGLARGMKLLPKSLSSPGCRRLSATGALYFPCLLPSPASHTFACSLYHLNKHRVVRRMW
jgi:hypothetical protein